MRTHNDEAGDWRGLDSPPQVPRYRAIADILRGFSCNSNILDVGCGEAVMCRYLPKEISYTGLEPSLAAVQIARKRNDLAKIIHARAEAFTAPGQIFDCIIFNEMLYYTADPVGLLQKYSALLHSNGAILCSIFQKAEKISWKRRVLRLADRRRPQSNIHCEQKVREYMTREGWPILDDRIVAMPGNESSCWHIWIARPPHEASPSGRAQTEIIFTPNEPY